MTKIDNHLTTIRSLTERIDAAWRADLFDEVENLSRLLLETVEMVRVHAKVAKTFPQALRVAATLKGNTAGTVWDLRADDGRSILFYDRGLAEAYAKSAGWEIKEIVSYA